MPRNFCLLRWVPGVHRLDGDLAEREALVVGSYLARLHRHAEGRGVPEGSAFPRWDWGWPFGGAAPLWDRGPSFYSADEMKVFGTAARLVRGTWIASDMVRRPSAWCTATPSWRTSSSAGGVWAP